MTRPHDSLQPPTIGRLVETLRHLRWRQVAWRGWYVAAGPLVRRIAARPQPRPGRRQWPGTLASRSFLRPRQASPGSFTAVGETGRIDAATDWNSPDRSKLWLFNVHYLDDLANESIPEADRGALLDGWIAANPPARGVGWHPYPTSLRLVNAIKLASRRGDVPTRWLESFASQAHALDWQVEHQIGANHVFANAKALVFAGAFLDGPGADRRLARGLRLLDAEVAEQFLPDGGHYERSPMYHSLALWDLCDLLDLARASGLPDLAARTTRWRDLLSRGLGWLAAMTHPDGQISFFNDAAFGVAPTLAKVGAYASACGCDLPAAETGSWPRVTHLAESGYVCIAPDADAKLIIDVAPIEPAHQPGHAHADTLSFELSVHGHRLIVNSGTSTYATGPERHRQRSTAAHSTVEVDGGNSSDVWKSFRVGRRARPFAVEVSREGDAVTVQASHDGYRHLPGRPVHTRRWTVRPRGLSISDEVSGDLTAVARFHLHPEVRVDADRLELPGGRIVTWAASAGAGCFVPGTWRPEFNASVPNVCLELPVLPGGQRLDLAW